MQPQTIIFALSKKLSRMKSFTLVTLLLSAVFCCAGQTDNSNNLPALDKSPMDMSYYPVDYPKLKMAGNRLFTQTQQTIIIMYFAEQVSFLIL